jgi:MFS transporter, FSR family, fosmidomycin resistance protein
MAAVYGLLHAVVDGACAALLAYHKTQGVLSGEQLWTLFLIYNGLAFALQLPLGAMADFGRHYRTAMLAGAGLVCLGVLPWIPSVHAAIALVAVGNAAFHVGAGATVLRISPERATAAGLFVAPGSLGLVAGAWCGQNLGWWPWLAVGALALTARMVVAIQSTAERRARSFSTQPFYGRWIVLTAVGLLFSSVVVRSTVGMTIGTVHEGQATILLGLAWAAFFGKAVGGLIADRYGWIKTSVLALVASAPLLLIDRGNGVAAIAGMFLFQMTMPVTLLAIYRAFPDEPGLSFGLPTLALFIGSLPVYVLPIGLISAVPVLAALVALSLLCLIVGLPLILKARDSRIELVEREEYAAKLRRVIAESERLRRHIDGMEDAGRGGASGD